MQLPDSFQQYLVPGIFQFALEEYNNDLTETTVSFCCEDISLSVHVPIKTALWDQKNHPAC